MGDCKHTNERRFSPGYQVPRNRSDDPLSVQGPWWRPGEPVIFCCLNNHVSKLSPEHTVCDEGHVDPSVICDAEGGCKFHRLDVNLLERADG